MNPPYFDTVAVNIFIASLFVFLIKAQKIANENDNFLWTPPYFLQSNYWLWLSEGKTMCCGS